MMASNLHLLKQAPHLMHLFWSMVCFALVVPDIAVTGQTFLHAPQPTHLSVIA
jgi:hypothetical protein